MLTDLCCGMRCSDVQWAKAPENETEDNHLGASSLFHSLILDVNTKSNQLIIFERGSSMSCLN